jgi:SWI/SNF-related matrix-associated actin-dependent regulator 1 of chromatin subfamily A
MTFNGLTSGMGEALNEFLRTECMVRRTKAMVLKDLPRKMRSQQFIALDDRASKIYAQLEKIAAERAAESRAAAIVQLNLLRGAIGTAKIHMSVNWITDMMETTDKSLVVFATHKDVQHGIVKAMRDYDDSLSEEDENNRVNVTHILGGQKAEVTEDHKARFQAKESRVIVLSFDSAREGHTLTAASDVLFVEYGWNPGTQSQAEDRCHRIGQEMPVTAWYLCGMDTIDEWSYELIESKRQVVNAVTDGHMAEDDEVSAFVTMVDKLAAKHGTSRQW